MSTMVDVLAPRSRSTRLIGCIGIAALVLAPLTATSAELAKWDQARVTEIAQKLVPATNKLYVAFYDQTVGGAAYGGSDVYNFKDKVRLLHSESEHLAAALKDGKGQKETRNVYFRIKELNDDAAMYGRAIFEENPTIGTFADVEDLIDQLAPYYDKHWKAAKGEKM